MIVPLPRQIRAHPKLPRVDHIPRSYAIMVRDAMVIRLKAMKWFDGFYFSTNKALQVQPENIPFCGVYFIEQVEIPDGDPNAGEPRFRTTVRIGFSVIIQGNDYDAAEYKLDTAYQAITRGLLMDPSLYNNRDFKIQAYVRGSRRNQFGTMGAENEWPVAELQYELTCDLGTIIYEPLIPDMLERIHVEETNLQDVSDPSVAHVIAEWEIESD